MQIENIQSQEELDKIQSLLTELSKKNSELVATTVTMDELNLLKAINSLGEKIDMLTRTINNIFDGHILIDGRFTKINI